MAFHAHPDDEALFTGGTLARAAAEGHRVVLVTATAGERGLAADAHDLGAVRTRELEASAAALGVARLVLLGYGDSGMNADGPPAAGSLCAAPVGDVAERLRAVLEEESADALTVYDANGGYGHRDHVRVHDAGTRAAADAGTPLVLEATLPREALQRAVGMINRIGIRPGGMSASDFASAYRHRSDITHEVDVRPWLDAKLAALRAHASQAGGGGDIRTVRLLSRLPRPLARRVLGREWYVERGRIPDRNAADDLFASLRGR